MKKLALSFLTILLSCGYSCLLFGQVPGHLDLSFDPGFGANSNINGIVVQPDGKIIIAGHLSIYNGTPRNRIARINADGSLDATFHPGGGPNNPILALALQADGKILIGGQFSEYDGVSRNSIARLDANGSLDPNFDPGEGFNHNVHDIIEQPDGKILIAGQFSEYDGVERNRIVRVDSDGSLDSTFDPGEGANNIIRSIILLGNGKIYIGGGFSSYDGNGIGKVARIESDGSLDASFITGTSSGSVDVIALQSDGKVVIGGAFTFWAGNSLGRIARLDTDGNLDLSFNTGTGASSSVRSMAVQSDDKVVIGGHFTEFNGTSINRFARINTDGSLDTEFDVGSGSNNIVSAMKLQPDGKLLIGGDFTEYRGTPRNRIARVHTEAGPNLPPDAYTGVLYAGGSTAGNLDGTGGSARFNGPQHIAHDASNDRLVVADAFNHLLRTVSLMDESVSTLAGEGTAGFVDGSLLDARFNQPSATVSVSGMTYVADKGNHAIRLVTASQVTTLTGKGAPGYKDGTLDEALFRSPTGIAYAGGNILYVADHGNHCIRKIDLNTNAVTTLSGTNTPGYNDSENGADSRFRNPWGMVYDSGGQVLYVSDYGNHAIREVSTADGSTNTIVGNGSPGFEDGDGSGACLNRPTGISAQGLVLYFTDHNNRCVREYNQDAATLSTLSGQEVPGIAVGANSRYLSPVGVCHVGPTLYMVDAFSHRVVQLQE